MTPRLEHTKFPAGYDGNIMHIMGWIRGALRECRIPNAEIDAFSKQVMEAPSYHAALAICAEQVDMTDWLEANDIDIWVVAP